MRDFRQEFIDTVGHVRVGDNKPGLYCKIGNKEILSFGFSDKQDAVIAFEFTLKVLTAVCRQLNSEQN